MVARKVLGNSPSLKQSSYRAAVAVIIRGIALTHAETDQDIADRLGCSAATIGNARNERGDLSPVTLLRIGEEYGLHTLTPVMLLIGAKAAPIEAICTTDREMPVHVAGAQLFLSRALSDDDQISDAELREGRSLVEAGGQVFDALRLRLHRLLLEGTGR